MLWKNAKVLLILKKGKCATDPSSYRPISLTPSISSVFESVINNKWASFCDDNKIIPDYQFGFRHRISTTHAVHKLLSDVNSEIGAGRLVGAAFLDIEKAFDSVWLNGLIFRLLKRGFPPLAHSPWSGIWYLGGSSVCGDGTTLSSGEFRVSEGLQQGTVNSPILFNIFLSELPSLFGFNKQRGPGPFIVRRWRCYLYVEGAGFEPVQNK